MSHLTVRIIGEASISIGDRTIGVSASRLFGLLLCLARHPGRRHSRGSLAALLFPDAPGEAAATHSLRQLLYLAKREGASVQKDSDLLWVDASSVTADVDEFLRDVSARSATRLAQGVHVLTDYRTEFSEPFTEWLDGYRSELEARIRHQLAADLAVHKGRSDWLSVAAAARACLDLDPLNETATLHLAESLAHSGLKAEAVRLLDEYARDTGRVSADIALPASVLRRRVQSLGDRKDGVLCHPPLAGRTEQLTQFERQWAAVRGGCSRVVRVLGEQGSGRTRLLEEFVARATLSSRCAAIVVHGLDLVSAQPFALLSRAPFLASFRSLEQQAALRPHCHS